MNSRQPILTQGQMASLLLAITLGSAIVYVPGSLAGIAGNGSWISILLAYAFGMIVLAGIVYLHRKYEGASLVDCCRKLAGRYAAYPIMLPIIALLLFSIPAILTGVSDFFSRGMMPRTPGYIFSSLTMLTSAMTARAGMKATARMFLLLVPIMIVFTLVVAVFALPLYDWGRLLPVSDKGMSAVIQGFYVTAGFPFGEVLFFSMVMSASVTGDTKVLYRKLYAAFSFMGAMMLLATVCTIVAFGPASGHLINPLYQMASNIELNGTSVRIEAIIGIALILGSYMKMTVYLLVLNRIVVELLETADETAFIHPLGLLCTMLSLTLFSSPAKFTRLVYTIWPFCVLAIGCSIILILVALTWIRSLLRSEAKGGSV